MLPNFAQKRHYKEALISYNIRNESFFVFYRGEQVIDPPLAVLIDPNGDK